MFSRPLPKNWGLIICIEKYDSLPNVKFVCKDAPIIKDYFVRILGVPNNLSGKKSLAADENYVFLENEDRKKRLKLRVHLHENAQSFTEDIDIIALSGSFQLDSVNAQKGIFCVYNSETAFISDLIGEVISISLKNRTEALLQYEIHKSKKGVCP